MKAILYMAMTVNGMIARENDETPWSDEEWECYKKQVKEAGNIIIGQRTYDIMRADDEFASLGEPFIVVVTDGSQKQLVASNTAFASSPKKALDKVKNAGFETVLVGGGSTLNASFLKEGLIDEIILDVEPLMFGRGIPLLSSDDFEIQLDYIGSKKISGQLLQLHYRVK